MPTAVVVATVVNTNMSETAFRHHVDEQLRTNERSLLDTLADADGDADVVTAVLNVDEFLAYLIQRFPNAVDAAMANGDTPERVAQAPDTSVVTDEMGELEFMEHVLGQLQAGEVEAAAPRGFPLSAEAWQAVEDEAIGEDFSRYPFLY